MEGTILCAIIIFLIYKAYCFLQEGGLPHTIGQMLFWMIVCGIGILYIIYDAYWSDDIVDDVSESKPETEKNRGIRRIRSSRSNSLISFKNVTILNKKYIIYDKLI